MMAESPANAPARAAFGLRVAGRGRRIRQRGPRSRCLEAEMSTIPSSVPTFRLSSLLAEIGDDYENKTLPRTSDPTQGDEPTDNNTGGAGGAGGAGGGSGGGGAGSGGGAGGFGGVIGIPFGNLHLHFPRDILDLSGLSRPDSVPGDGLGNSRTQISTRTSLRIDDGDIRYRSNTRLRYDYEFEAGDGTRVAVKARANVRYSASVDDDGGRHDPRANPRQDFAAAGNRQLRHQRSARPDGRRRCRFGTV